MITDALVNYTKYNVWANNMVLEFIKEAGEEKADVIQNNSFPTIRKTLYHIWGAETIWLKRLMDESLTKFPNQDAELSLATLSELFLKNSKDFAIYVEEKTEIELNSVVHYNDTKGNPFSNLMHEMVMHCMNHSTYHRGQLVTMLRNVGFTNLASTDYITFCRL